MNSVGWFGGIGVFDRGQTLFINKGVGRVVCWAKVWAGFCFGLDLVNIKGPDGFSSKKPKDHSCTF